jgi:periplasmic mercuric ion binding protein
MKRFALLTTLSAALLANVAAFAGEHTVTLAVEKMDCETCPYIIKRALTLTPGVKHVEVSYEQKTAVVTFDDAKTDVSVLTKATTEAGFPSHLQKSLSDGGRHLWLTGLHGRLRPAWSHLSGPSRAARFR